MMKNLLVILQTWVLSLLWEDPLEMEMATHSGILTWRIPWTEEPGWLQSTDSQRVGHNWATNTFKVHLFPFLCGQSSELWQLMSRYSPVFVELLLHLVFWYPCDSSQDMAQNIVYSPWERTKGLWLCLETQFNSVPQSCLTLCNLMDCSRPSFPIHHQLPGLAQTHVHQVSDAIQPSHPLSLPSPPAFNHSQHQGLFEWVSSLHQVARVLEFQLQHQSFQWIFRTDFLSDRLVGPPCSPRDSQESSPTPQFKSINSSALSFLYGPTLTSI